MKGGKNMKSLLENKKGQYSINSLGAVAIAFVVAAIVFGIGAVILKDVGNNIGSTDTTKYVCNVNDCQ